jgi:hypothetical protein
MSIKTSAFVAPTATTPLVVWDGLGVRTNRGDHRDPTSDDYDQLVAEILAIQADILNNRIIKLVNDNAGTLVCGTPVYIKSNGHIDAADGNGAGTRFVFGLVVDATVVTTGTGRVQFADTVTLTTAQWDAVAGTSGGLTAGQMYWLSDTVVLITSTAPSTVGDTVFRIGLAVSSTQMLLRLNIEKTA